MKEDIAWHTVVISVQATGLTGRVLCKAFQKFLTQAGKQRQASLTPYGRQSVKQLMGHGGPFNSIQLEDDARLFDRAARESNVDYAFHKVGPKDYPLFFKAGQADVITAASSEYTRRVVIRRGDRLSILGQFRQFEAHVKIQQKEREETREAVQER